MSYNLELFSKNHIIKYILREFINENFESIIGSTCVLNYRNKINFSFGYYNGSIECGPLQKDLSVRPACTNDKCSLISINICEFMKDWIKHKSNLLIYFNNKGFWRHITIFNNKNNDIMIVFHVNFMSKSKKIFDYEFKILINHLNKLLISKNYKIKTIYYQNSESKRETRNTDDFFKILDNGNYFEKLDNYKFLINPGSFFQVNSYTAEIIYRKVYSLVEKNDTLFDLCCGTGTIGCYLSDKFTTVYGIDYNKYNIENAINNSKINNIKNIKFLIKKIEDLIDSNVYVNNSTAVLNPPRKGVHKSILEFINKTKFLKQLVYVSCNVNTLLRDLKILDISKENIKNIIPVDQFPKCNHCEVIVNIIF